MPNMSMEIISEFLPRGWDLLPAEFDVCGDHHGILSLDASETKFMLQ
jgi:hypothetical protein